MRNLLLLPALAFALVLLALFCVMTDAEARS